MKSETCQAAIMERRFLRYDIDWAVAIREKGEGRRKTCRNESSAAIYVQLVATKRGAPVKKRSVGGLARLSNVNAIGHSFIDHDGRLFHRDRKSHKDSEGKRGNKIDIKIPTCNLIL